MHALGIALALCCHQHAHALHCHQHAHGVAFAALVAACVSAAIVVLPAVSAVLLSAPHPLVVCIAGVGIGVDSFEPKCDLDISGSGALRIPSGETSQRPSVNEIGQVRFNTTTSQFEGYNNSDAWQGLGGVIDVDQDTYILAESAPTADEDQLTFYTSGSQKMKITKEGNFSLTNPFVETGWNQFGQELNLTLTNPLESFFKHTGFIITIIVWSLVAVGLVAANFVIQAIK